jgi:hypothetical protein
MTRHSRMLAGILLVTLPSVMYGGLSLLRFLTRGVPGYAENPLRHDLWRAGHAHARVYLVLSLVMLRYVDETALSPFWKWIARAGAPIAAILIPAFFSVSRVPGRKRAEQFDKSGLSRRSVSCRFGANSGCGANSCCVEARIHFK